MQDLKVWRLTGAFGLAACLLLVAEIVLWTFPAAPPLTADSAPHVRFLAEHRTVVLTRLLLDLGMYVGLMVFMAGFRHLILRANPAFEWLASLTFAAGIVWWAVTLVADGLEGAVVLDSLGGADPSATRALLYGTLLIYNGSIAFAVTALFMGAAGFSVLATGALPRWLGWVAYASAALCLLAIPSMYGNVVDSRGFYNTAGWGPSIAANLGPLVWYGGSSLAMLLKGRPQREHKTQPGRLPAAG